MAESPRPRFTHFALFARDLEKMRDFYTRVMNLTVSDQGHAMAAPFDMVFMSNDPREHHQFVLLSGRPDEVNFHLNQQMSFLVDSLQDLRDMKARVEAEGVENYREANHGNAWSIYFDDPEGNNVEIYVHTPWYIRQPHQVPFDLSKSDEEIYAETEAYCRTQEDFMTADERAAIMSERIG